jgi:hypothetical protein
MTVNAASAATGVTALMIGTAITNIFVIHMSPARRSSFWPRRPSPSSGGAGMS